MLAGNLTDFSIEDIFQLFALTKKSGALRLAADRDEGRVYFAGGEVYFAVTDVRRLALGARLVGAGHLSGDTLREIAAAHTAGGPVELARTLLTSDAVDTPTVQAYLRDQIVDAVSALMRLDDAAFTFDNGAREGDWTGPRLSTQELLEEGRRRLREWAEVTAHVPDLDRALVHVPTLPDATAEVTLTRDQWQLLSLVDGRRSTTDLVDLTGAGEYATGKLVAGLVSAGLVEVRPATGRTAMEELLAGRESLRRLERIALAGDAREHAHEHGAETPVDAAASPVEADGARPTDVPGPAAEPVDDPQEAAAPEPVTDDAADGPPAEGEAGSEAAAGQERPAGTAHGDDEDGNPPAARPHVDRAQMARELASLGLGDLGARRGVNRASAEQPRADARREAPTVTEQSPERGTMVEHRLARDAGGARGRFSRLIDGVSGA